MFTFVETKLFSRLVVEYLTDEEYVKLQGKLIQNSEAGAVVSGSGGVRKLRWAAAGRGKRAGYRVIYFARRAKGVVWMLTIYPKSEVDSIPGRILSQIREELEDEQ